MSENLKPFFSAHVDTGIFCFQEVFKLIAKGPIDESVIPAGERESDTDLFHSLEEYLPSHAGEFCQTFKGVYGLATFLSAQIEILHHGEILVAKGDWETNNDEEKRDHNRKAQWMELKVNGKSLLLVNTHLTHRPEGKMDSEKRLKQSKVLIDFLSMFSGPKILVGDFNLLPDTESIKSFEKAGMRNLVREYKATSTRTELYRKFKDGPKFADYIFVSPDIHVNDFKVLPDLVSDHSPLLIDFDLK